MTGRVYTDQQPRRFVPPLGRLRVPRCQTRALGRALFPVVAAREAVAHEAGRKEVMDALRAQGGLILSQHVIEWDASGGWAGCSCEHEFDYADYSPDELDEAQWEHVAHTLAESAPTVAGPVPSQWPGAGLPLRPEPPGPRGGCG